ncbi:hypothetical protein GGS20DRAFT_288209 [Poronia punctata]|nr:hypothetical protein GGS20DRAFT_288209 [Poronia punctata]
MSNMLDDSQENAAPELHVPIISERLYDMCRSEESVSSLMGKHPDLTPADAWLKLMERQRAHSGDEKDVEESPHQREACSDRDLSEELHRARDCGKWGRNEPSDLFISIYNDTLCNLNKDPGLGMVSPSLLGRSGTIPLTIISVLPDIVRHMSNLIVRAEKEVFLATNFWQNCVASRYLTDAIRELSRRVQERDGNSRVVIKVLYDRGNPRQVFDPHHIVRENEYTGDTIGLPPAEEIPSVDLQVINYHQPLMGTFHAKYMIVDRRIAIVQSNNVQDNDNLEMMVQVEGPIVDSLYDMALLSWNKRLDPPLPCLNSSSLPVTGTSHTSPDDGLLSPVQSQITEMWPEHTTDDPHYDDNLEEEARRAQAAVSAKPGETAMAAVTRHLNHTVNVGFIGDAPDCDCGAMTPYVLHSAHEPFPMALVNRAPYGRPNHKSISNPQNVAWLSALRKAQKSVFIQTPTLNAEPVVEAIREACERGIDVKCYVCLGYNDAGEMLPFQNGHNEKISHNLHTTLSHKGLSHLHWYWYVGKDQRRPIPAMQKKRSCHIKLMMIDDHVAIVGSGNQDTQSWFHSQETNIMIDSAQICREWTEALERNQNTRLYGAVSREDGVWKDENGGEVEGATGVDVGRFPWAKGVVGAVRRLQGTGGF